jgi:hypothetical protein
LARVRRVNRFNADIGLFGLVGDERLKLVEVPRMDSRPLRSVADIFEYVALRLFYL